MPGTSQCFYLPALVCYQLSDQRKMEANTINKIDRGRMQSVFRAAIFIWSDLVFQLKCCGASGCSDYSIFGFYPNSCRCSTNPGEVRSFTADLNCNSTTHVYLSLFDREKCHFSQNLCRLFNTVIVFYYLRLHASHRNKKVSIIIKLS
ncbi:unnamed protein product [Haemonchus placei]|uniref:Uncharacterized protein n=1 Tax=Haemonchus placei TaxID=6290 RepID=A0A3P7UCI9_HAEPC|nr:unnamed protein product [Haemonchus placei]